MFSAYATLLLAALALAVTRAQDVVIVEDDALDLISYTGQSHWSQVLNPVQLGNDTLLNDYYHGKSGSRTSTSGAAISFVFNGSRIAYYGGQFTDHGTFDVILDGEKTVIVNASRTPAVSQVKFFDRDVDPDIPNHNITVTCNGDGRLTFDYFNYTRVVPTLLHTPGNMTAHSTGQKNNMPIIVGVAVAGLVAGVVLAALAFWLYRRRQGKHPAVAGLAFLRPGGKPASKTQPSARTGGISGPSTPYDRPTAPHKSVS